MAKTSKTRDKKADFNCFLYKGQPCKLKKEFISVPCDGLREFYADFDDYIESEMEKHEQNKLADEAG